MTLGSRKLAEVIRKFAPTAASANSPFLLVTITSKAAGGAYKFQIGEGDEAGAEYEAAISLDDQLEKDDFAVAVVLADGNFLVLGRL